MPLGGFREGLIIDPDEDAIASLCVRYVGSCNGKPCCCEEKSISRRANTKHHQRHLELS